MLNILTKLLGRIFSYEYELGLYEPVAVNFLWNSCWCGMFWLNKRFITSCWSIKKHCHSVWGYIFKIQYLIACQNNVCMWFLEFSILFVFKATRWNKLEYAKKIRPDLQGYRIIYAEYENCCYCCKILNFW